MFVAAIEKNEFIAYLVKLKNDIKLEVENLIRKEIGMLNIGQIIEEQNKKIDLLIKENDDLRKAIAISRKKIDGSYRINYLIFYGFKEGCEERLGQSEKILDLCNKIMGIEIKNSKINYTHVGVADDMPLCLAVSILSSLKKTRLLQKAFMFKGSRNSRP